MQKEDRVMAVERGKGMSFQHLFQQLHIQGCEEERIRSC